MQTKQRIDLLAQLVEHIPFKDRVLGSNPRQVTKSHQLGGFFCGLKSRLLNEVKLKSWGGINKKSILCVKKIRSGRIFRFYQNGFT